jgi:hypothetical protein
MTGLSSKSYRLIAEPSVRANEHAIIAIRLVNGSVSGA